MHDQLSEMRRRVRRLEMALAGTMLVAGALALSAFVRPTAQAGKQKFTEIDAERVNIVEPTGKLRLTISNSQRLPDLMIGGKSYPLRGGTGAGSAGFIFFNDEGDENGGLIWGGKALPGGGHRANAHLTFDQYAQDETLALSYTDVSGQRRAGLTISDRADIPIQQFAESAMVIRKLPTAEQARRMEALRTSPIAKAAAGATRVYVGKSPDRSAVVVLADPAGRPRMRLVVDSLGASRIEFLGADGAVQRTLP